MSIMQICLVLQKIQKCLSLGDYTIYFYTTTDREGFDINTTNPDAYTTEYADGSKETLSISTAGRSD